MKSSCVECLAESLCKCRASGYKESFCITDALLAAAVQGDVRNGLFYTGQSVTGIEETEASRLPTAAEIFESLEAALDAAQPAPSQGLPGQTEDLDFGLRFL